MEGPEKTYICIIPCCAKSYSSKYNLKRHIDSSHRNIRPFSCPVCSNGFASKQNLRDHSYIHENVKLHGCPECGKHFRQASQLLVHRRIHKREESNTTLEMLVYHKQEFRDLLLTDLLTSESTWLPIEEISSQEYVKV